MADAGRRRQVTACARPGDCARRAARRPAASGHGTTAPGSPSPRRSSSRSPCCAATAAATAPSPRRRPGSARPYLSTDEVLDIARAGRGRRLPRGAVHPRRGARGPATRWPPAWLDEHGYASTVDYLVGLCALVRDETGLLPHANAGALGADELARLRAVSRQPGDDARVARPRPGRPPRRRRTRPRPPAGHPRGRRRAGRSPSPPGCWSASARSRADRLDALEAIAASHRRHGHVQEVIVQNFLPKPGTAMHGHPPCPPDELLVDHRRRPARAAARDPPAGAAQPLRRPRPAARAGHRRLGRRLAGHRRPRQPRAGLAGARRPPRRHRGGRAHASPPGSPSTPSSPSTRSAGSTRRCASPCSTRPTPRASAATTRWCSGGPTRRPASCSTGDRRARRLDGRRPVAPDGSAAPRRGAEVPSPRCSTACSGQELGEDEHRHPVRGPRPRGRGPWPRWPTSSGARRSATWSPTSSTATSTTPTSAPSSAGSAPSPRVRSRSTSGARPTCSS